MLVPYYVPDLGPSAPLFAMLGAGLVQKGHQVTVIAAVPHYPSGTVPQVYRKKWLQRSVEKGVEVIRVRIPSMNRSSLSKRLLQFICYQIGAVFAGLGKKFDVAYVANPALWVWLPFMLLIKSRRVPAIFTVQDVYPDVGVALGIFKQKSVINAVASLERSCLRNSTRVQIISDSFRPGLHALGVTDSKMVLINNWVDTNLIQPLPRNNSFAQENDLVEKFVVLYAGNIGLSQGLEHVLSAAEQLKQYQDIKFVFVGDGAGREPLMKNAVKKDLSNALFIPFQPRSRLPEVLATADVSLVILRAGVGAGSLPSKVLSILASGRPILASVDEGCDTWTLVERATAGICVPPDDPQVIAKAVLALKNDRGLREKMGANGRFWAQKHHSPQYGADQIEKLMQEIKNGR